MLWIAFNLYFYRVHWQLGNVKAVTFESCELLSICIFIGFIDNLLPVSSLRFRVVNCFQFVFLSGSLTTIWWPCVVVQSCELLSICIFIGFIDNLMSIFVTYFTVVNCFQFVFLSGSLTTTTRCIFRRTGLWIAFNLYFYRVHWQLNVYFCYVFDCCELLSICIFIGFIDNCIYFITVCPLVVNCFQFVFLSGSLTTHPLIVHHSIRLWIAFNLYFYRVHWQHTKVIKVKYYGCELLSICIFIGFIDNNPNF